MIPLLTIITLPANFVASSTAYIGEVFTDISTYIVLLVGLPLAFWVIKKVISLLKVRG